MRIIEASKMQADESTLTGESLPVEKQTAELAEETVLAERNSMLYKGTAVTRGSGLAVVVSTGLNTELGKISSFVEASDEKQTPLEDRLDRHWLGIVVYGLIITVSVLGALYIGLHYFQLDNTSAVTLSFLTLAFAQLWHVFNMRGPGSRIFDNTVVRNPWVWGALLLCIGIILGTLNIPTIAEAMKLNAPNAKSWLVVLGMSLVPFILGQLYNGLAGGKQKDNNRENH